VEKILPTNPAAGRGKVTSVMSLGGNNKRGKRYGEKCPKFFPPKPGSQYIRPVSKLSVRDAQFWHSFDLYILVHLLI
jgi:hypothetical protein